MGKVVHTVKRAGTYVAKVSPQELHKIAVHVRAVMLTVHRETLTQYITFKRGERGEYVLLYYVVLQL